MGAFGATARVVKVIPRVKLSYILEAATEGKACFEGYDESTGKGRTIYEDDDYSVRQTLAEISTRRKPNSEQQSEDFAMQTITMNTTTWKSAKKMLFGLTQHVVYLQEHKLRTDDEIAHASQWADAQGWQSVFNKAHLGKSGNANAGGVAILVKKGIGLTRIETPKDYASRLVCAAVEVEGMPVFTAANVYLKVGVGLKGVNLKILAAAGHVINAANAPAILGGDMNATPREMQATEFIETINGVVFAPAHAGGIRNM